MTKISLLPLLIRMVSVAFAWSSAAALADSTADFYRDKRITFVIAGAPGGGFDTYARVLARHMQKHIPGNPDTVVQSMQGAGGVKSSNHMYNVAPRDGTVISMPLPSIIVTQLLRPQQIKYDAKKFNWVGTITTMTDVIAVWHAAGVRTVDDAKKKEVIFGTSSKNSMGYQEPALANALLGTKFKIILGYHGMAPTLAMERGEVQARANQWVSWRLQKPKWLQQGTIVPILQFGPKDPEYSQVPAMIDLVKTDHDRSLVRVLHMTLDIGRSVYTTFGVPRERIDALRRAFDATLIDPAFRKEMTRRRLEKNSRKGQDVQQYVRESLETPASVVEAFKEKTGL